MKKILFTCLFLLLISPAMALATWTEDFFEVYDKTGLDTAIINALDDDITPEAILSFIIQNKETFNIKFSLKTLYCAGVDRDVVQAAASKLGITIKDSSEALEESIAECGAKLVLDDRENSGILVKPAGAPPVPGEPINPPAKHRPQLRQPSSPSTP